MRRDESRRFSGYTGCTLYKSLLVSSFSVVLVLAGCSSPRTTPDPDSGVPGDGGEDGGGDGGEDSGTPTDGSMDSGVDSGDGGTVPGDGGVIQVGEGLVLRGVVLTPSGPLDPGEVYIVDNTIRCVAADCSGEAGAADATIIETAGVISPGLIDAHNHLPYNFFQEWVPDPLTTFDNRYVWSDVPSYEDHVRPYSAHRSTGTHYCPAAKWGELRSIIHGATTIQGQSFEQGCVNRLARNADHFHGLGYDHMRTSIGSPRDITDSQATSYVDSFVDATEPTTRLAVHMGEGVMGSNIDLEFGSFAGRDTRTNRHAGTSLLEATDGSYRGTGILIHSVAVNDTELLEAADTDSKIVWSPSSNLILYGQTVDIGRIIELGITVGIGPDWTVSGEDELLSEMRFALDWARAEGIAAVTPEALVRMATEDGAEVVGLPTIGTIEVGQIADIAVFARLGSDPYLAVIESRAEDVSLVLIDGEAYYGDLAFEMATAVNGECDMIDACGRAKFICVKNTPGATTRADESLDDIETQLVNILEGTGYPADEQYGRGDELLPLISCE